MERPIKELLIILRDNARVTFTWFGLKQRIRSGLCAIVANISNHELVTRNEMYILHDYIEYHRPRT